MTDKPCAITVLRKREMSKIYKELKKVMLF